MLTTTQLIPEPLDRWSKNRGNFAFAIQSGGKDVGNWGNASEGPPRKRAVERTCAQGNRLCSLMPDLIKNLLTLIL
jgi:hypothetical protein